MEMQALLAALAKSGDVDADPKVIHLSNELDKCMKMAGEEKGKRRKSTDLYHLTKYVRKKDKKK